MIGTRLGQYELIEEIGKGGMATVFRAYQPNVDRYVAVKVIHRSIAADTNNLERFQREARLVTRLEHPHLLPIYDYDGRSDPPYIVMRYLEGGTLKDILDRGRLPHEETIYMLRQIASALDYAHRRDVIHRDIKPTNIIIDQEGNAFLTDFGIARAGQGQGLTQTGFAVGTPGYMSPEQGMGEESVDRHSDIYSLGIMVYQMLVNEMPYTAETPMAVILKHINDPIPRISDIDGELPPAVDKVIEKALAKKPHDRYQTATELIDALANALKVTAASSPSKLRQAAQATMEITAAQRSQKQDQINDTMAKFEASRGMPTVTPATPGRPMSGVGAMPDVKTTLTPTGQPAVPNPSSGGRKIGTPFIIGAVILVIALIAGGLALSGGGASTPTPTVAPTTAVAIVPTEGEATVTESVATAVPLVAQSSATNTKEAATAEVIAPVSTDTPKPTDAPTNTDTPQPTDTIPPTETDTPTVTSSATDTDTPTVTSSPTQTDTPAPTNTPLPSATSTPATPVAQTLRSIVARSGPGSQYAAVASIPADDSIAIIGISEDGGWFKVLLDDGREGWLAASAASVSTAGNLRDVPVALAPSDTPTWTPTATDTATDTPTATATDTSTPTDTATATYTPTDTPTSTSTPTATNTPTATETPTSTATDTVTPTATATSTDLPTATIEAATPTQVPSPTPIPAGQLPYVADFEGDTPVQGWDYDPANWQVVTEGGERILIGQGKLEKPLVILGLEHPEWLDANTQDLVISFSINLDTQSGGARVIFRCANAGGCPNGYNVLEIFPGLLSLKRNAPTPDIFQRESERVLKTANAPIAANEWHNLILWIQGSRLFVYLDGKLALSHEDLITPQLGAGAVILQTNSTSRPVRWDNFIIQRPETASEHFQTSGVPSTWQTTSTTNTTIGQEDRGNQYLDIRNETTVTPNLLPIRDISLTCRIQVRQGGYQLKLRESANGSLLFDLVGGNLTLTQLDGAGNTVTTYRVANFYNRNRWEDVVINFVGDKLSIYRDGTSRFEESFPDSPGAGGISFTTGRNDILWLDDCLITETATTRNAGARFAIQLQEQVLARDFRELRSDLTEDFADRFRTDVWWVDGLNAPGQYMADTSVAEHQKYLRLTHDNRDTYRLFRDNVGVAMFGRGEDNRNFTDTTDLYVTVEVRFPEGQGTAWLGLRSTPTISGASLNGYRMELTRAADGTMTIAVRYSDATQQATYYEGPVPTSDDGSLPEWTTLVAISYKDKVAFFANGQFVVAVENAQALGGTLALGVNNGTTADFDTLIIRDTTPHGE